MSQVTLIKIVESESYLTVRANIVGDADGDLVNVPLLYPSSLVPALPNNAPTFRILELWYGLAWFDFTLLAGTLTPVVLWTVAKDCDSHNSFRCFGGIPDQNVYASPPVDDNGALLITTRGLGAGMVGSIVLSLGKLGH